MFLKEVDHSTAKPLLPPPIPPPPRSPRIQQRRHRGRDPDRRGVLVRRCLESAGWRRGHVKEADSCHFAYKALTGNCAIVAKVESVQNTSPAARAGVMIRTSLDQGAPRAWMCLTSQGNLEQNAPNLVVYGGTNYGNKALANR